MKPLRYYYRKKIPLNTRGVDLFKIGDVFLTPKGDKLTVIEIVPYGMYPKEHPKLRVYGYYREEESYVVRDEKGNRRWPRIGNLLKFQKVQ